MRSSVAAAIAGPTTARIQTDRISVSSSAQPASARGNARRLLLSILLAGLFAVVGSLVMVEASPSPTASASAAPLAAAPPTSRRAAVLHKWGSPVAGDEFNYTGAPKAAKWSVYNSPGHAGNGLRRPSQIKVDGSKAILTGTSAGTTGGMAAKFDRRKYGRWETRMRVSARDPQYHPVLILWPDSGKWPCHGEIDYAEGTSTSTKVMNFFHHYSCSNEQTHASRALDATQWHNYAVEWTPKAIVGYLDGVEWFRDAARSHQPPGPMHQTVQLDWFPSGGAAPRKTTMEVRWVRVYD
jgi:beta-glucanase (GH16 family)